MYCWLVALAILSAATMELKTPSRAVDGGADVMFSLIAALSMP
jgi:hypothetical protein